MKRLLAVSFCLSLSSLQMAMHPTNREELYIPMNTVGERSLVSSTTSTDLIQPTSTRSFLQRHKKSLVLGLYIGLTCYFLVKSYLYKAQNFTIINLVEEPVCGAWGADRQLNATPFGMGEPDREGCESGFGFMRLWIDVLSPVDIVTFFASTTLGIILTNLLLV